MIIICTGINSRDRELLSAYLISQKIPDKDVRAIADECIAKANESYPHKECGYSDFATIGYLPDDWIIKIDRAYTAARS